MKSQNPILDKGFCYRRSFRFHRFTPWFSIHSKFEILHWSKTSDLWTLNFILHEIHGCKILIDNSEFYIRWWKVFPTPLTTFRWTYANQYWAYTKIEIFKIDPIFDGITSTTTLNAWIQSLLRSATKLMIVLRYAKFTRHKCSRVVE